MVQEAEDRTEEEIGQEEINEVREAEMLEEKLSI